MALFFSSVFIGLLGHQIVLLIDSLGFNELTSLVLLHLCWEMIGVLGTWQGCGSLLHLQSRNNESCIEVHCQAHVYVMYERPSSCSFGFVHRHAKAKGQISPSVTCPPLYFKAGSPTEAGAHSCSWIGCWPVSSGILLSLLHGTRITGMKLCAQHVMSVPQIQTHVLMLT